MAGSICRATWKGAIRQKGSRNKLGEAFMADVYAKWKSARRRGAGSNADR
jgi:hypothetical protein